MSRPSGAVRKTPNELNSFDISKRSPEQIAQLFTRWKEQRKRLEHAQEPKASESRTARHMPITVSGPSEPNAPASGVVRQSDTEPRPLQYSADFAAILELRADPAAHPIKDLKLSPPAAALRTPGTGRSKLRWVLAGAASVIAVTAMAGVAWLPQNERSPAVPPAAVLAAGPAQAEPVQPEPPAASSQDQAELPFLAAIASGPAAEPWLWQEVADAISAPPASDEGAKIALVPRLKPSPPAVQTASQTATPAQPASAGSISSTSGSPAVEAGESDASANASHTTFLVVGTREIVPLPRPPAAPDDSRADDGGQLRYHSDSQAKSFQGESRIAASRGDPDRSGTGSGSSASGSAGGSDAGGSASSGGDVSGGTDGGSSTGGNTGGSSTGGSPGGSGGSTGGSGTGGDTDGSNTGGGASNGGDPSGGTDGGSNGSAGGSDAGGSGDGGASSGGDSDSAAGGDTGGSDSDGSGDAGTGGGSGDGDSDGGDGDSDGGETGGGGLGDAIGGALGGARDAIGGALGGARDAVGGALD